MTAVVAEVGGGVGDQPGLAHTAAQLPGTEEAGVGVGGEAAWPHPSIKTERVGHASLQWLLSGSQVDVGLCTLLVSGSRWG